jgi:hypothetical protein
MPKRSQFFPGRPAAPRRPLARYRPHQPVGAVADYVRALTAPGDLVLDLFCQGPTFVKEAFKAGRRAVGFSINPLLLVAARLGLVHLDRQALTSAFTMLADSLKGDKPLQSHVLSLYRSTCPVCDTPGVAEWFAWDRDLDYPFEKAVRCHRCGEVQVGPANKEDTALAHSIAPRGLAYYYALDRAAPPNHPARDRATELVDCYTPRNLSALMDLNRRLEGLEVAPGVKLALIAVLVDCFDRGSRLYPYGEDRPRPRTLRIPVRYLERNVWFSFEDGLSNLRVGQIPSLAAEAEDAGSLVRGDSDGYALVARAARAIRDLVAPASASLIFVDPPCPDGVFWALSALWATWLWSSPEAQAMRPFLARRRFDWDWHWRALRKALRVVGPCLTTEGSLVILSAPSDGPLLESVCLAASSAGYGLRAWGYTPETGYRLIWHWEGPHPPRSFDVDALKQEMVDSAERAVFRTLSKRGEPTPRSLLVAAEHTSLVEEALLPSLAAMEDDLSAVTFAVGAVDQGFDAAPVAELRQEGTEALWWLSDPPKGMDTLADRVEATVRSLLAERPVWAENDLINAVYARFPSMLTPDLTLVGVCVESYGVRDREDIRLRPEDDQHRRHHEVERVREDLITMGRGLGYDAVAGDVWDVRWREHGRDTYGFAISSTARVAPYLLDWELPTLEAESTSVAEPIPEAESTLEARRCLVVPGGRARLIDLKLQRDPRLVRAVERDGWRFIKFRHLRRLMARNDLDRYAFKTVLGLDPIVEREGAQIPLF